MAASLGMALVPATSALSSLAANKASIPSSRPSGSFSARAAPKLAVAAAVSGSGETAVSTEKEPVDVLPNGEWAQNYSMLNYEDLSHHLEDKAAQPPPEPSSPLVTEGRHGVVSGEWSENISILSYEELFTYFGSQLFKKDASPTTLVGDVMKREVRTAFADQTLGEIAHHFEAVSGMPVVNEKLECVGVVSRDDRAKAGSDDVKVKDVMSPPLAVIRPNKSVLFAATLMLKTKMHRIPVLNESDQLVGIVTRTDIFTVLEAFK